MKAASTSSAGSIGLGSCSFGCSVVDEVCSTGSEDSVGMPLSFSSVSFMAAMFRD